MQDDSSNCEIIMSTFHLLGNRRMRQIMPIIVWSGLSFAYWFGFTDTIVGQRLSDKKSETVQYKTTLLALSILGVGEIVGAIGMGRIIDKSSPKIWGIVNVTNLVPVWALAFLAIQFPNSDFLLYLFTFAWGYMDAQVNTHLLLMLGFDFDTLQEPFSIGIMVRSTAATILFLLQDLIDIEKSDFIL